MNVQTAVVFDEAQLPKLVHEETHPGPRRPDHFFFLESKDGALRHRGRRGHAKRLPREATFTKKIPAPQDCDDRFLPTRGEDRQLHLALLNVKHRVRATTLREDGGFLWIVL